MKKTNLFLGAAVAGLFAVSAHAGDAAKKAAPTNEKDCATAKMTWKDGACTCAANSCTGKDAKAAPAADAAKTAPAAPAAPAKK